MIRQLTTGTHDFESLIRDKTKKCVDKTDQLFGLAESKTDAQYFISRPRPVPLIGINFNPKVRNIDMPAIERIK